jgi:hypothetical protein
MTTIELPLVTLPDIGWTIIRVGDRPGHLYAKTRFGKWTEIRTGKLIHDTELAALANEIVGRFTKGSGRFEQVRVGFTELIDPDRNTAATSEPAVEPTEFEYQLMYLDGDPIHDGSRVRGPKAHAIEVWNTRRDPANELTYGPDIKLQRRPIIEWEDFRVPTAEDLGETTVTA